MGLRNWVMSLTRSTPEPVKAWRVGISPGHGGKDPGAISVTGQHEADLARIFSKKLEARMKVTTMLLPAIYGYDEYVKNYVQRVRDSDANKDTFYMPVHFNAGGAPTYNGWMILVDPADVKQNSNVVGMASSILTELVRFYNIGFADYDVKKDGVMAGDYKPIYEVAKPKAYTLYLELGFLSNLVWCARIADDDFMSRLAGAVVTGMTKYLSIVPNF